MLANEKYIGRWRWGATKGIRNSQGKSKRVPVHADQHVVRDRPHLRIIDQETWEAAQRRLQELHDLYGSKPGQKRRGPKTHYTVPYPASLLGALIYCATCGSRMWIQGTGNRAYMLCGEHQKGRCSMAGQVRIPKAEIAILEFVTDLLTAWPPWLSTAASAMRGAIAQAAAELPEALRHDEVRLTNLERRIDNLVVNLADGGVESLALRRQLTLFERETEEIRARLEAGHQARASLIAMPDDQWIEAELGNLPALLQKESHGMATLLRRLLGRVTAECVVAPGKQRGFIRLRFRVSAVVVLKEVLGGRLPAAILSAVTAGAPDAAQEFTIDLGGPTRRDQLAPEIATMRERGMTWAEIGLSTGLGTGNAYNVWKRWTDAQTDECDVS
jgi:hypothetical protein